MLHLTLYFLDGISIIGETKMESFSKHISNFMALYSVNSIFNFVNKFDNDSFIANIRIVCSMGAYLHRPA